MPNYDADDLSGLGRMFMRSYSDGADTVARRARRAFIMPTLPAEASPTPFVPTPAPVKPEPMAQPSADQSRTILSLEEQLKKARASEAALTKTIREAQQEPPPGVQPTGLQLAFRQARNTIAALQKQVATLEEQLKKTKASEAALTKTIREAQQEPPPGVQPTGLQLAFRQARQRIAQLEAQLKGAAR
ncbi:MAG: hypothetical protein KF678_11110 [Phycisphaeraceae bacterium]|nr:hypothetical protein [Phycisphaeraceae bacterium]